MNFIDAGFYNNGKYVEDLTYFSFDKLTEQEKGVNEVSSLDRPTTPLDEKEVILKNEYGNDSQSAA